MIALFHGNLRDYHISVYTPDVSELRWFSQNKSILSLSTVTASRRNDVLAGSRQDLPTFSSETTEIMFLWARL
jgi:hypothetical protein